jgi:tetratricopeptide (TPR) repeat protein
MQARRFFLALLPLALAACYPRQPVAPPPPAPVAPPPAPTVTAEDAARARRARAERFFAEGVSLGRQSRWADAAERYRLAAEANPDDSRYPMALSQALSSSGREWEAADALQAAIRLDENAPNPNHRVLAVDYDRLIAMLTRLNRLDEARTAQERQAFHRRLRDAEVPE